MPVLGIGKERMERGRVVGIVEDHEPAGLGRQPLLEGEDGLVQVVLRVREMQPPGELAAACLEGERRFRIEPEDHLVLVAIAVGVLDGRLGLADAAQSGDGLSQDGLAAPGQ